MASTISYTHERIARLHNNAIVPNDDQDGVKNVISMSIVKNVVKTDKLRIRSVPNTKWLH